MPPAPMAERISYEPTRVPPFKDINLTSDSAFSLLESRRPVLDDGDGRRRGVVRADVHQEPAVRRNGILRPGGVSSDAGVADSEPRREERDGLARAQRATVRGCLDRGHHYAIVQRDVEQFLPIASPARINPAAGRHLSLA